MEVLEFKKPEDINPLEIYDSKYYINNPACLNKIEFLNRSALILNHHIPALISSNRTTRIIVNLPNLYKRMGCKGKDFRTVETALEELNKFGFFYVRPLSKLEYIIFTPIDSNKIYLDIIDSEDLSSISKLKSTTIKIADEDKIAYENPKSQSKKSKFKSSVIDPVKSFVKKHVFVEKLQGFAETEQSNVKNQQELVKTESLEPLKNKVFEASQKSLLDHSSLNPLLIDHHHIDNETLIKEKLQEQTSTLPEVKKNDDDIQINLIEEKETISEVVSQVLEVIETDSLNDGDLSNKISEEKENKEIPFYQTLVLGSREHIQYICSEEFFHLAKKYFSETIEERNNTEAIEFKNWREKSMEAQDLVCGGMTEDELNKWLSGSNDKSPNETVSAAENFIQLASDPVQDLKYIRDTAKEWGFDDIETYIKSKPQDLILRGIAFMKADSYWVIKGKGLRKFLNDDGKGKNYEIGVSLMEESILFSLFKVDKHDGYVTLRRKLAGWMEEIKEGSEEMLLKFNSVVSQAKKIKLFHKEVMGHFYGEAYEMIEAI